ncbi:hypothetical protein Vretimale_337 [Volvox reticuliferus]|nr:hypothetical protein Vretifemale_2563 [Volvox reticuliferus]GIL94167.1 hypothetical protein Vretimale_337 [Volvox reticuliferus]
MFMVLDRNGAPVMNGKQRLEVIIIQTLETDTMSATTSNGEVLDGPVVAVLCQAVGMCIPNFTNFMAPEPEKYKSARGHAAVSAVAKVNSGHLFPLPKALVFVERPAIFVPHSDILAVEFRRPQSVTFDLVLHTAPREAPGESGAGGSIQKVEFSQIDKGEMGRLQSYFANSKIKLYDPVAPPRLGNGGGAAGATAGGGAGGAGPSHGAAEVEQIGEDDDDDNDDDDDDEDFDPSLPEHLISGHPPAKRPRTDPSGSGAGPSNASGAGPSSGRCDVDMGEEEEEDEEDEESEDEESEGEDDEDELADLTDEDDLRADDVRQRVRHGDGMHATDGGRRAHLKRPRSDDDVEDEEEEDEDEDEEEED